MAIVTACVPLTSSRYWTDRPGVAVMSHVSDCADAVTAMLAVLPTAPFDPGMNACPVSARAWAQKNSRKAANSLMVFRVDSLPAPEGAGQGARGITPPAI